MSRLKQLIPRGTPSGMSPLKRVYDWFEFRVRLEKPIKEAALHPVPRNTASWFYVFGSAAFVLLIFQVITGILLGIVYTPSAGHAWASLQYLNHDLPLGWFIRALHGWGSDFMVAVVLIHMCQVFTFGSYKYPRELTWILGVFLLLMTLGMAFTGQVMRFDQDAYWGLGIGAMIMSRVPFIGGALVHLLLGGPIIAGPTLTRFYDLHVFVIPGLLLLFAGVHVWMVLVLGITEWPMPGRIVKRSTYLKRYETLVHEDGIPFVPGALWKDVVFAGCIVLAVVLCSFVFGPFGPTGVPDPTILQTVPKPDFFFLWIYSVLALLPPNMETVFMLVAPLIGIVFLIALPLFAGEGERHWRRRPIAVLSLLSLAVFFGVFQHLGETTPWSPKMDAWSGDPIPVKYVNPGSPLIRQGEIVFQLKQCRDCHMLGGKGGQRGPALDDVATRLTPDQLVRQVLQGGGNMPAFGKNLTPPQVAALVAFLETLHKPHQRPAKDASSIPSNFYQPAQKAPANPTH